MNLAEYSRGCAAALEAVDAQYLERTGAPLAPGLAQGLSLIAVQAFLDAVKGGPSSYRDVSVSSPAPALQPGACA